MSYKSNYHKGRRYSVHVESTKDKFFNDDADSDDSRDKDGLFDLNKKPIKVIQQLTL